MSLSLFLGLTMAVLALAQGAALRPSDLRVVGLGDVLALLARMSLFGAAIGIGWALDLGPDEFIGLGILALVPLSVAAGPLIGLAGGDLARAHRHAAVTSLALVVVFPVVATLGAGFPFMRSFGWLGLCWGLPFVAGLFVPDLYARWLRYAGSAVTVIVLVAMLLTRFPGVQIWLAAGLLLLAAFALGWLIAPRGARAGAAVMMGGGHAALAILISNLLFDKGAGIFAEPAFAYAVLSTIASVALVVPRMARARRA